MFALKPIGAEDLHLYKQIPMVKGVSSVFRLVLPEKGLGGIHFQEEPVDEYMVDMGPDSDPLDWAKDFNLGNWGFALAWEGQKPVGAVALAYDTPGVNMLAGRRDLAVLWDIRVDPDYQGKGIGKLLFDYAVQWARERNCTQMKIETQQDNVKACRFYARQGCHLGEINRYAYYGQGTDEVMLIWYLDLA